MHLHPVVARRSWLAGLFGLCLGLSVTVEARPPNIIIFLADDLGYGELGMQGNPEIPTPHIDSLAKHGVRFTAGYVSGPYCSPTRAGLMTGRYQTRFGHEWNEGPAQPNGRDFGLPVEETTIADRLKALGYATIAIGKWHLGRNPEFQATKRGFDEFYGTVGNTPFYNPPNFIDSRVSPAVAPIKDDAFYTTDAYAARAVDWIERQGDKPYFLYLPFNAQHAPLQAPAKYLDRFPNITDPKRKLFAAMLSGMDDAVGAVLSKVRQQGHERDTLIAFVADNGGPTQSTTSQNGPLRGYKASTLEGGVRVPFCMQWVGKLPSGIAYDHPVIQLDLLPTAVAAAGGTIDPAWRLDGVNLLPYLTDEAQGRPHETLYWRFGKQWAIRHGDWKLVAANADNFTPKLFDLKADIGEANDLSNSHSEKRQELQALWDAWNAEQLPARWLPNPNTGKKKKAAKAAGMN